MNELIRLKTVVKNLDQFLQLFKWKSLIIVCNIYIIFAHTLEGC